MAVRPTFNLKHFEQISASMMNLMASVQASITDFNIGSVNRTLLEAVALELEEIYYRTYAGILDGIPAGVYDAFGYGRLPAAPAIGNVTFSRDIAAAQAYNIAAGTIITTSTGIRFATTVNAQLLAGSVGISVPIAAEISGTAGNVAANSITLFTSAILGIDTVTNPAGTSGGVDDETADAQQIRFAEFIVSLARSPVNGIEAGAKTAALVDTSTGLVTETVSLAKVVEPYLTDPGAPVGLVTCYIDNGSGSASNALVAQTQKVIDGYVDSDGIQVIGYRAAGIIVTVTSVILVSQDVTALITLDAGADQVTVNAALTNAIATLFNALNISDDLDWPTLLSAMMVIAGVKTVFLMTPSGTVPGTIGKRFRPGTIVLSYQ